ncbi:MAG: pirin family protein [Spirochaetota bacterium]
MAKNVYSVEEIVIASNIEIVLNPKEKNLGDSFIVRRVLPFAKKRAVGPFVFWDHMGPVTLSEDKPMLVRAHPHIGLATITYLFSGAILHRDSLNNEQWIRPGEVNWMTAGSGIVHSERAEPATPEVLEGIQLWVGLPTNAEEVEPSFVHKKETELPIVEKDGIHLRLIAGSAFGEMSPLPVYSPLFYLNGQAKAGQSFSHRLPENQEGAIYIVRGKVEVEGQQLQQFQMACFSQGGEVNFQATEDLEFMLLGGEPFSQPKHMWWNFVSHDLQRIEKAKEDWKHQRFAKVINETEFIPLP